MRWLVRILGVVIVAVIVAVVGLLMLPGERIARIAADQVQARTGRALDIGGEVSVTLWPVLGVTTGPVRLANAEWAGDQPMLVAQGLSIAVGAPELLRGEIRVIGITADQPVLRLQSRADGRGNWEFGAGAPDTGASSTAGQSAAAASAPVTLERLELSDATVSYADDGAEVARLDKADLTLRWPDRDGPAEIDAVLRPAGAPVTLTARLPQPGALMEGAVAPLTLRAEMAGGTVAFDGQAAISGAAAGRLVVETTDSAAMLAVLGQTGASVPQGMGRVAALSADLTYTNDGRVSLRDLAVQLDANRLTGAVDVVLREVPQVTAQLQAGVLDLRGPAASTTGGGGGAAAPGTANEGWSREAIDASALGVLDADISLTVQGMQLPDLTLGATQARLRLDRSRAVLDLARVAVFDGTVSGQLVANNRNGLSVGGKLAADGIDIQQMQRDLMGLERIQGRAVADLEFLGVGNSVDAIMRSLSGKGGLRMGRGVILGFDLDRLMQNGQGGGGTTVFDSLSASYTLQNGDLINRDLLVSLKNFRADGDGRIGLGGRDIDYLFTPVALRANSGQGLALPIRIKGPWGAPRIIPDFEAAAKARADVELRALEDRAKAQLQQKLEQELDVKVQDGQDPEEVLKDRLEDEAKKGLLKLLGRD